MGHILKEQHGRPGVEAAFDMPLCDLTIENLFVTVDPAKASDGDVFAIPAIQEIVGGCAAVFAVFVGGYIMLFPCGGFLFKEDVIGEGIASLQYGPDFQMKFQIGAKHQRPTAVGFTAWENDPSAACCSTGIDGSLDRRGIICDPISCGTKL